MYALRTLVVEGQHSDPVLILLAIVKPAQPVNSTYCKV